MRVIPEKIIEMSTLIAHRGPDDVGHVLIDTRGVQRPYDFSARNGDLSGYDLALANRRLAIIDLSSLGHQPMAAQGCTLIYNGEIYNYLELRAELSAQGHAFESRSDTEVLLHAYLEWGVNCLSHLNGMFAFAIWDARSQTLFCARDRIGIKPFYYYLSDQDLIFASEIKSILSMLPRKPEVNPGVVYDFLSVGRLDHTAETFFEGIIRLPAGCYILASREQIQIKRYWELKNEEQRPASLEESGQQFRELFIDAVRLQMRSDVTVGSCLSGGMDSSALVCVAASQTPKRMQTFTARYHDATMDEWRYAQLVADHAAVDTAPVFAEPQHFWRELPDLLWTQEEPFGGPSVYAQWNLMRTVRAKGVRVLLDGQGGDELLCGYAKYFYFALADMHRQGQVGRFALTLLRAVFNGGAHLYNFKAAQRYLPRRSHRLADELLRPEFRQAHAGRHIVHPKVNVRSQQILDVQKYSLPVLLRYEDKNSMAHSIESRVPFLDHRLVEFAISLPTSHKLAGAQAKRVMRESLTDVMPPEILRRRTKLGFGGTFSSWIDGLKPQLEQWLDARTLHLDRYVQRPALRRQLEARDPALFRPLILDNWLERFGYS